jgi:ribonucleoside-diphosphate reductase alpha chain
MGKEDVDISKEVLSEVICYMKYAKYLPDKKRRETWEELVDRNKFTHIRKYPQLIDEISNAYKFVYDKKVLPAMRSLQFGGKAMEINNVRGFNCSFLPINSINAFSEIMFLLLSGSGVGFSVQKHDVEKLPILKGPVNTPNIRKRKYLIGDSIIGWASAIKELINSYFKNEREIEFDFRDIRPKGAHLITAGGKAPGPQPLKDCIHNIRKVLDNALTERGVNCKLKPIEVHDVICYIADAVLAGGIRRSATISIFSIDDEEMMTCKYGNWWESNPQRGRANNSVMLLRHKIKEKDFFDLWKKVELSGSGEPGIIFSNDKTFGMNPCAEAALKPFSFCNLTTINVNNIDSQEEFNSRCRAAAFLGTLQASYTDFHFLNEQWTEQTEKDALLGVSLTGIASNGFLEKMDLTQGANIVLEENERVAKMIGINKASRTTLVKPEGCQVLDTLVSTKNGFFELGEFGDINGEKWQNISGIDFTYTDEGIKKIGKFFNNGVADTKLITTTSGLSLESTLQHKYKILREKNYDWVCAQDLKEGDILPYSVGEYDGGEYQKIKYSGEVLPQCISVPTEYIIDEDFAWFLGLYYADGSNHKKGIRISGNWGARKGFDKLAKIILEKFKLNSKITKHNSDINDKRCQLVVNSTLLVKILEEADLLKNRSYEIEVPLAIRKSPKSVINAFFEGFIVGDGNINKYGRTSFVTTSYKFAKQAVIIMRSIGTDAKLRIITSRKTGFGKREQYWVSTRLGRLNVKNSNLKKREIWEKLDSFGLKNFSYDTITSIQDSKNYTVDFEVEDNHTYIANSYVSHNTVSLVCGTSSGIHAWHAPYYMRRVRVGRNEAIYEYFRDNHPEFLEDDQLNSAQAILKFPIKAPEGSKFRTETPIDLLERVKKIYNDWILPGHRKGSNHHNSSCTVSIKPDEWEDVGKWMWENREYYNGISVLPYDGGTYVQPPFEECTKEEYEVAYSKLGSIDLTKVVEDDDVTEHKMELSCAGGACEVK